MAIGKANAYATVEAPRVDFGDIALNAQKIQQADLERMKDMIPKPEKSDYEYKGIEGGSERSNIAPYDFVLTQNLKSTMERVRELNKEAEANGGWTAEGRAELNSLQNTVKTFDAQAKGVNQQLIKYSENIDKYSDAGKINSDYLEKFSNFKNIIPVKEGNNYVLKLVSTDDNGNPKVDENGDYVYEKYNDRGVLKDSISLDSFNSGKWFNNLPKKMDETKVVSDIAKNLDPNSYVSDNGTIKHTITKFTSDQLKAMDKYIDQVFSNDDNLIDYLYKTGDSKWKDIKTREEYVKEGGLDIAKKQLRNQIYSAFGFKDETDVTLKQPKEGKDGEEDAYLMADGITYEQRTGKDKKTYQTGITIPIYDNKIKFGYNGKKTQLNDVRFDYAKKQVNITLFVPSSESEKYGDGKSSSTSKGRLVTVSVAGPGTRADFGSKVAKYLGVGNDNNDLLRYIGDLIPEGDKKDYYNRHILSVKNTTNSVNSLIPPSQKR